MQKKENVVDAIQDEIEKQLKSCDGMLGTPLTDVVSRITGCHRATVERARAMLVNMGFIQTEGKPGYLVYRWVDDPGPRNSVDSINVVIRAEWERVSGVPAQPIQWIVNNLMEVA